MNKHKIKAFTLVELIVVIAIISILWTIAFISLHWYASTSRDSVRISDLKNMEKTLELSFIKDWEYAKTSSWKKITYSWAEIWTQWTFWNETVIASNNIINPIPLDPLTKTEYNYSLLNTKLKYQLWAT